MRRRLELLELEDPDAPTDRIARAAQYLYHHMAHYVGSASDAVTDAAAILAAADEPEVFDLREDAT